MTGSDLPRAYARCFRGDDGMQVLRHLRSLTLDVVTGPDTETARLRHLEGQRYIVHLIHTLIERGQQ